MLMKKLLWTACAAIALTASAGINAEEYVVGTGATYRPFEYETPQKELVGFDVDLMRAIAKAEGFDVKFSTHRGKASSPLSIKATATSSCPVSRLPTNASRLLISPNPTSWLIS